LTLERSLRWKGYEEINTGLFIDAKDTKEIRKLLKTYKERLKSRFKQKTSR